MPCFWAMFSTTSGGHPIFISRCCIRIREDSMCATSSRTDLRQFELLGFGWANLVVHSITLMGTFRVKRRPAQQTRHSQPGVNVGRVGSAEPHAAPTCDSAIAVMLFTVEQPVADNEAVSGFAAEQLGSVGTSVGRARRLASPSLAGMC
jgi:hypothetical protein